LDCEAINVLENFVLCQDGRLQARVQLNYKIKVGFKASNNNKVSIPVAPYVSASAPIVTTHIIVSNPWC
jgi:hypothetical protein